MRDYEANGPSDVVGLSWKVKREERSVKIFRLKCLVSLDIHSPIQFFYFFIFPLSLLDSFLQY